MTRPLCGIRGRIDAWPRSTMSDTPCGWQLPCVFPSPAVTAASAPVWDRCQFCLPRRKQPSACSNNIQLPRIRARMNYSSCYGRRRSYLGPVVLKQRFRTDQPKCPKSKRSIFRMSLWLGCWQVIWSFAGCLRLNRACQSQIQNPAFHCSRNVALAARWRMWQLRRPGLLHSLRCVILSLNSTAFTAVHSGCC
eukprot:SAG31_NODE_59_length_29571_cov_20.443506_33_plen_193_part_00